MKYHGHEIIKTPTDLGEDNPRLNYTYEIFKDGKFINVALSLSSAKEFVDSGCNPNYL